MKQTIVNIHTRTDIIDLNKITPDNYIGIKVGRDGLNYQKGFVTKTTYYNGEYTIRSLDDITKGNGWDSWDEKLFSTFLKKIVNDETLTAYMFDSYNELFTWLLTEPEQ